MNLPDRAEFLKITAKRLYWARVAACSAAGAGLFAAFVIGALFLSPSLPKQSSLSFIDALWSGGVNRKSLIVSRPAPHRNLHRPIGTKATRDPFGSLADEFGNDLENDENAPGAHRCQDSRRAWVEEVHLKDILALQCRGINGGNPAPSLTVYW